MKAFALAILLAVCGATLFGATRPVPLSGELTGGQRVVEIRAHRYAYEPNIVTVRQGETVVIKLVSQDVTHGFFLDGYEKQFFVPPGDVRVMGFKADRGGRFTFRCSVTCGSFHPYMTGQLKVVPNRGYYGGILALALLGLASIGWTGTRRGGSGDRLFGFIPLDWKFELTRFAPVRRLLKSRWFPLVLVLANFAIFSVILVASFTGGLSAGNDNFGVMVVWILWWVLLMTVFVPLAGRFWCMMCPFPLLGDWLQRGRLVKIGRQQSRGLNRPWPQKFRNLWPVTLILFVSTFFSGFFTVSPFATFVFLGFVVAGAVVVAMGFEKRSFCLYVCPVSGFQGLYANFAATEVRVKDTSICAEHFPKTCYVGDENGYGCPWLERPFDMRRNTYCGMCMECFKSCPYDNMAFNIRPFGADFIAARVKTDEMYNRRGLDEAFKSLTMVGILFAFFLTMQGPYGWLKDMARVTTLKGYGLYLAGYTALNFLLIPGLFLLVAWWSRHASGRRDVPLKSVFVEFSYALIPIGVARWAAFSLGILLPNGSYLLNIVSDPFALGWNLFGTAHHPWTPFMTGALPLLQSLMLIAGMAFSLDFGFKFSRRLYGEGRAAQSGWMPMMLFLVGLGLVFLWLFEG